MTPSSWTIHNLKFQDRDAVLAWVDDPATRLTSKWAAAVVALNDRRLTNHLGDRLSDDHRRTWPLLLQAIEASAPNSLSVLLQDHAWPDATLTKALEQATRQQEWDCFQLLWPRMTAPFGALRSSTARTMLIRGAPTRVWMLLCQSQPPVDWATECLGTMVSQNSLRDDVVAIVERLASKAKAKAQAKQSWALQRALISDHEGLVRVLWPHSDPMAAAADLAKQDRFGAIDRMTPWLTDAQQLKLCQDHFHRLPQMYALVSRRAEAREREALAQDAGAPIPMRPRNRV